MPLSRTSSNISPITLNGSSHIHGNLAGKPNQCPTMMPPKPKKKAPKQPLQFKRGTARAFREANIVLLEGQPAVELDTHKLKIGDGKTKYNSLPYIGEYEGKDGKSAYQLWKDCGHNGTVEDFLNSLVGEAGKSTYEIWLSLGNEGTLADFIGSLQGYSSYELWIQQGNTGSVIEYLDSLKGLSAYQIWLSLGNEGDESDFIDSLKGLSAFEVWKEEYGNEESTIEDYIYYMSTISWGEF